MRKALPIFIALVVLILVGIAVYFIFFRSTPEVDTGTPGNIFGGSDTVGPGSDTSSNASDTGPVEEVAPRLLRITSGPVALGFSAKTVLPAAIDTDTIGTSTAPAAPQVEHTEIRYVERKSGNVYMYDSSNQSITRIGNQTLPGIEAASWTADGSVALLRFLSKDTAGNEDEETYVLTVASGEGYFLEPGLSEVFVTGSSTIVTLLPNSNGSIATAARVDGAEPKTLFSSLLASIHLLPAGSNFAAYTKPSASLEGYGFSINGKTGAFERIVGPLRGLTLLPSPSGKLFLYSGFSGGTLRAALIDPITRATTELPLAAMPEKCVWSHDERTIYCAVPRATPSGWPDTWYQGTVQLSDRIWKIDLDARAAALVLDPETVAQVKIDGVALTLDPQDDYLIFTNRTDGSLWAYDL